MNENGKWQGCKTVIVNIMSSGTRRHAVFQIGTNVSIEYTALIFRVQCAPPKLSYQNTRCNISKTPIFNPEKNNHKSCE